MEIRVASLAEPSLQSMGFALVQVKMQQQPGRNVLQVLVERADGDRVSLDECTNISYTLSALLDVEDPLEERYELEVSSPGIERPLVRPQDFVRFTGRVAKITTASVIHARRKFSGVLEGANENEVLIKVKEGNEEQVVSIPHHEIVTAKLVLTDELFKELLKNKN